MKAVKILSLIAALLMCLSLAACYQQTDVLEGAEEKENVLTADPNYAAPAQQEDKTETEPKPEPETGSTSAPTATPDKTDAASPEAPKDTETATDEPTVPQAEEGEIVVDVKEEIIDPERLPEGKANQKRQLTIGKLVNLDIREATFRIRSTSTGDYTYTEQPVGLDKWEKFRHAVAQDVWTYQYYPGGNEILLTANANEYELLLKDVNNREYAVHFRGACGGVEYLHVLDVPEGYTHDEYINRPVSLYSSFAHYTIDEDFCAQLLEIFTK